MLILVVVPGFLALYVARLFRSPASGKRLRATFPPRSGESRAELIRYKSKTRGITNRTGLVGGLALVFGTIGMVVLRVFAGRRASTQTSPLIAGGVGGLCVGFAVGFLIPDYSVHQVRFGGEQIIRSGT